MNSKICKKKINNILNSEKQIDCSTPKEFITGQLLAKPNLVSTWEEIEKENKNLKRENILKTKEIINLQEILTKKDEFNNKLYKLLKAMKEKSDNELNELQEKYDDLKEKFEETHRYYWRQVDLVGVDISKKEKKDMKDYIKQLDCDKCITDYVEKEKKLQILKLEIDRKKKVVHIDIIKSEEICNICFTRCRSKPMCKICKESNTCHECEVKQKNKFGKCAFCNMPYSSINNT